VRRKQRADAAANRRVLSRRGTAGLGDRGADRTEAYGRGVSVIFTERVWSVPVVGDAWQGVHPLVVETDLSASGLGAGVLLYVKKTLIFYKIYSVHGHLQSYKIIYVTNTCVR
jgi:hypothetical protein